MVVKRKQFFKHQTIFILRTFLKNQEFTAINRQKQLNALNFQIGSYNQATRTQDDIRIIFQNRRQKPQINIYTLANTWQLVGPKRFTAKEISINNRKYFQQWNSENLTGKITVCWASFIADSTILPRTTFYSQSDTPFLYPFTNIRELTQF